jgi:hypothetical protein
MMNENLLRLVMVVPQLSLLTEALLLLLLLLPPPPPPPPPPLTQMIA